MATYDGWTEMREYRVSSGDEFWQVTTVSKHRNGWFNVDTDGYDVPYRTRSESDAYACAMQRTETGVREATDACYCHGEDYDQEEREACEDPAYNTHGSPHAVRFNVYDSLEGTEIESWNL